MKIRTNLYLITAILLTSNLLTLCEGDNDIDHEHFSDHLDHLDDIHDINNFDNHKVIHSVELIQHNGDSMSKYGTTSHTNQETNNKLFSNTIPIIQQSNVPPTFTKVVKQMVIKQSNNDGNNAPETDLSMKDTYGYNKLIENGIGNSMLNSQTLSQMDHVKNIGLALQQAPDPQGNIKNIIHTTVTKTTTSGNPSNELNESFNRMHNLETLPSNHIISTISSTNSNYKDGITSLGSSQSNSMEGNSKIKTISTTEDTIDGNGFDNSKRISRTPGGFRRTKTTIIKQHNIDDNNNRSDLDKSIIGFTENTSSNNILSMAKPLGYNTVTTTTIDRDNSNDNVFNKGTPSRRQQNRFNKLNVLGNSVSETGASQNPSSVVHTKTTIIKNGRAADEIKLDDLNDNKIYYNTENTSLNNIESSMTNPLGYNTVTTTNFDRDNSNDNEFNKVTPSRRQQNRFNKLNVLGNSVSETGASQNPGSFVHTKTTIIKNGRAADEIKLDDLNDNKIDYNIDNGMSTSNNNINSNYIISSNKNGNDNDNGYSYSYGYGNGYDNGNYNGNLNNMYNGKIISSNDLMDGSGGYSSYMISNGYSNGNGKKKKRKKNGSMKKYKSSSSKNISYNGKGKGNGQIIVKKGRKNKNTRSSKKRSGGNSQYYYSSKQSKSFASSDSASDESSTMKKKPCHCNKGRKLNKRDSNESNGSNRSNELRRAGNSMDNQPMQNNGEFITGFPPPIPPFIGSEPPPNLLFNMIQRQRPDQSLNYSQSDLSTALNRLGETRSQLINDHQLPNIDVSNKYLTYQIPKMGSLYKPDFQQEQYFGPPGPGPGPGPGVQPYPFDSSPFAGGDYRKFLEQNLQLPPLSQSPYPYSFNQVYDTDLSKMGFTTPELTNIQPGEENQININTDLPQMQQNSDNEGTGFNRMDALNSGSMTTRSNMIKNTNGGPIIEYIKTFKTPENIDDNGTPDMQILQTQSVPPEVNGYGIPNLLKLLQTALEMILQIFPGYTFESGNRA